MGIRKALGATVGSLVRLLSWDFLRLVALANVVAWPLAWLVSRRWLDGFAYRIDLGPELFAGGAAVAAMVAMAPVVVQATRASLANPVDVLRDE